jgi:hypothetical protein
MIAIIMAPAHPPIGIRQHFLETPNRNAKPSLAHHTIRDRMTMPTAAAIALVPIMRRGIRQRESRQQQKAEDAPHRFHPFAIISRAMVATGRGCFA